MHQKSYTLFYVKKVSFDLVFASQKVLQHSLALFSQWRDEGQGAA